MLSRLREGLLGTGRSVFICYRRDDSAGNALRIAERLRRELGSAHVVIDQHSVTYGENWRKVLGERLRSTCLVLVLIGRRWVSGNATVNRLQEADDPVRREIAAALEVKARILPILLEGATFPPAESMPEDVAPLRALSALPVPSEDTYFERAIAEIVKLHGRMCGGAWRHRLPWRQVGLAAGVRSLCWSDGRRGAIPIRVSTCEYWRRPFV